MARWVGLGVGFGSRMNCDQSYQDIIYSLLLLNPQNIYSTFTSYQQQDSFGHVDDNLLGPSASTSPELWRRQKQHKLIENENHPSPKLASCITKASGNLRFLLSLLLACSVVVVHMFVSVLTKLVLVEEGLIHVLT